jgi:hypothetical protein
LLATLPLAAPARDLGSRAGTAANEATIVIDGRVITISPSFVARDRALVSLFSSPQRGRSLASVLPRFGAKASFEPASGTVIVARGRSIITMRLGSPVLEIDGTRRTLDTVPTIFRGRVMVPIRSVAEALGAYVEWFGPHRLVLVTQHVVNPVPSDDNSSLRWLRAALDAIVSQLRALFERLWPFALYFVVLWLLVWALRSLLRRLYRRARLQVVPFSAPGFEGFPEHAVSIFAGLVELIASQAAISDTLARSSGYLGTAKGPVLIYPELGDIPAITNVLSAIDKGNIVSALIHMITRPEFRISGSALRAATDADVAVRVDRYGSHYWAGGDRRAEASLIDATKDLGFVALRAIGLRK